MTFAALGLALVAPLCAQSFQTFAVTPLRPLELAAGVWPDGLGYMFIASAESGPGQRMIFVWLPNGDPTRPEEREVNVGVGRMSSLTHNIVFANNGDAVVSYLHDDRLLVLRSTNQVNWVFEEITANPIYTEAQLVRIRSGVVLVAYNAASRRAEFFFSQDGSQFFRPMGFFPSLDQPEIVGATYNGYRMAVAADPASDEFALTYLQAGAEPELRTTFLRMTESNFTPSAASVRIPIIPRREVGTEMKIATSGPLVAGVTTDASNRYLAFALRRGGAATAAMKTLGPAPAEVIGGVAIKIAGRESINVVTDEALSLNDPFLGPAGQLVYQELIYLPAAPEPLSVVTTINNAEQPVEVPLARPIAMEIFQGRLFVGFNRSLRVGVFSGCMDTHTFLCGTRSRFDVTVRWRDPQGNTGLGQAVPLTGDTGYFWFFNDANIELVIKVLDGCGVNGRFWVFAGGLTNVEVDITVRDILAGTIKTYRNPLGTPFQPIQDTAAFTGCSSGSKPRAESESGAELQRQLEAINDLLALPEQLSSALQPSSAVIAPQQGICVSSSTALCLNGNRFRVVSTWQTPDGRSGNGQAVRLTDDSGYFWFFSPNNVELVTKVLNACAPFSSFWVFSAGLTNVRVELVVTDTHTGREKRYTNELGTAFQPIQDTAAFACTP